jgi:hypothetical protein
MNEKIDRWGEHDVLNNRRYFKHWWVLIH